MAVSDRNKSGMALSGLKSTQSGFITAHSAKQLSHQFFGRTQSEAFTITKLELQPGSLTADNDLKLRLSNFFNHLGSFEGDFNGVTFSHRNLNSKLSVWIHKSLHCTRDCSETQINLFKVWIAKSPSWVFYGFKGEAI